MDILHQVLVMVITLGILVSFHEYGHFWVARRCNVKVLRFSVGFGMPLFKRKDKQGTEYVIAALPLGGYVKMLDEREGEVAEHERHLAFNNKTVRQRIAIVSAGPIANLLLAVVIYWFVFLQGVVGLAPVISDVQPGSIAANAGLLADVEIISVDGKATSTQQAVAMQLIQRIGDSGSIAINARQQGTSQQTLFQLKIHQWLGDNEHSVDVFAALGLMMYQPKIAALVDEVVEGSAAQKAGIIAGDKLIKANDQLLHDWSQWVALVQASPERRIDIVVERDGLLMPLMITPIALNHKGQVIGQVGIKVVSPTVADDLLRKQDYSLLSAWAPALERTYTTMLFSLQSIKKMLFGDISYKQLSGPITIAKVASESVDSGIYSFLTLLALLSVSLGVLNLLPVPVLDGGHIVFYTFEWLFGKPVPDKIQAFAYQLGLAVVVSIMMLAFVNDLGRL